MCGITGYIDFNKKTGRGIVEKMIATLNHRGPDDYGALFFEEEEYHLGLAQSRLAIIDLSQGGHQPMSYKNYIIVFNGEIYNFQETKSILQNKGHQFKSSSDTEVILHAFEEWGKDCVEHFIGMFAIVIWDKKNNEIIFFRDRAGVKPLFYYWNNGLLLFSSELKAFHVHPHFEKEIDKEALNLYFNLRYIPSPYCIFKNCNKVSPGHLLTVHLDRKSISHYRYWDLKPLYKQSPLDISYKEAKEKTKELIVSACNYRMIADVPVGVFLSGGYDSTAVTSILQKSQGRKINTFTIGFEEGNNELPYAKETAEFLGTNHKDYYCTTQEAKDIIPTLPYFYDEPFADSSAIPTILVSKLAIQDVKVALSADGGDELFAGYSRYVNIINYNQKLNQCPKALKPLFKQVFNVASFLVPPSELNLKHRLEGIAKSMNKDEIQQLIDLNVASKLLPTFLRQNLFSFTPRNNKLPFRIESKSVRDGLSALVLSDYQTYLENDILVKVDRATMSVSLEGREPLLDHRLFEWAAQLPSSFKYDDRTTKKILKDIVHDFIPEKMMDRPKAGFSIPIYSWLKGDLSHLIDEYLNKESIDRTGLFNTNFVLSQVDAFRRGKLYHLTLIWKLLMFQMWYEKWML